MYDLLWIVHLCSCAIELWRQPSGSTVWRGNKAVNLDHSYPSNGMRLRYLNGDGPMRFNGGSQTEFGVHVHYRGPQLHIQNILYSKRRPWRAGVHMYTSSEVEALSIGGPFTPYSPIR